MAITFDDGYADNAKLAGPILEGLGMPATFFITAGVVGSGREFWWDRLANLLLSSSLGRDRLRGRARRPSDLDRCGQRSRA